MKISQLNEKGSVLLFNLCFILILLSISLSVLQNKIKTIKETNQLAINYLCMKNLTGELKQHKYVMNKGNDVIKLANLGKIVGLFTNPAFTVTAQKVKKATQKAQAVYHISYLKNLVFLYRKGCIFSPSSSKTNHLSKSVVKLQRNVLGLVKQRKAPWSILSIGKKNILKVNYKNSTPSTGELSLTQMAKVLSNFY